MFEVGGTWFYLILETFFFYQQCLIPQTWPTVYDMDDLVFKLEVSRHPILIL